MKDVRYVFRPQTFFKSQLDFWPDKFSEKQTFVEFPALHYFRRWSGLMIPPFLFDYLRDLTTFLKFRFFCQLLDFPCLFFVLCRVDRRVQRMIFKVEKLEIIFGSFYDNVPLFNWNWNYGFKPEKWECSNLFFLQ